LHLADQVLHCMECQDCIVLGMHGGLVQDMLVWRVGDVGLWTRLRVGLGGCDVVCQGTYSGTCKPPRTKVALATYPATHPSGSGSGTRSEHWSKPLDGLCHPRSLGCLTAISNMRVVGTCRAVVCPWTLPLLPRLPRSCSHCTHSQHCSTTHVPHTCAAVRLI
jgi:hypothetical protein